MPPTVDLRVTTYTLGIEGGPHDGQAITVDADTEGWPPYLQSLDGHLYVRMPFGLQPYDPHWHYCHRRSPQPPLAQSPQD